MAAGRVTALVARIRALGTDADAVSPPPTSAAGLRTLTYGPGLERAAESIRNGWVAAVAHASTGSSYALGYRAEAELVERLRDRCGVPVVASGSSAIGALRSSGSRQVALVHPPWFDDEIDE